MRPCKDGHVSVTFLFGAAIGPFTQRLMNGSARKAVRPKLAATRTGSSYVDPLLGTGARTVASYERAKDIVGAFLADQDQGRAAWRPPSTSACSSLR